VTLLTRLFLLVLVAVLPALATEAYNEYDLRRQRTAEVSEQAQRYARLIATEQDSIIDGARQLLVALSQLPALQSSDPVRRSDPGRCSRLFAGLNRQDLKYDRLAAFDGEGRLLCSSTPPRETDVAVMALPHIQTALAENRLAISDYRRRPDTDARVIEIALPFHDETGRAAGVIVAGLSLDWLAATLAAEPLPADMVVSVIDRNGTVLARAPDNAWVGAALTSDQLATLTSIPATPQTLPSTFEQRDLTGAQRIYGYVPSKTFPGQIFVTAGIDMSARLTAINRSTVRGAALIAAGLILALLAASVGSDRFVRQPLRVLLRAAARWRSGDWSVRANLTDRRSEIAQLGQAFDQMADALSSREQALQRSMERAESASHAKTNFLANMSHELRTPLNAVVGFSEMLKGGYAGPLSTKQWEYIEGIHSSGRHLLDLVGDILDMSTIEAGKLEVHPSVIPVLRAIESSVNLMRARAADAAVTLRVEAATELPPLYVDKTRFRQILLNLLSNAIKFTPPGGVVTVSAANGRDGITIEVNDTGIGMRDEDIPSALQPFRQIENAFSRQNDGVGLGLPLAKTLTELHGGHLRIASAPGSGTTVILYFPLRRNAEVQGGA
jgi:signal transduction histidine kinase